MNTYIKVLPYSIAVGIICSIFLLLQPTPGEIGNLIPGLYVFVTMVIVSVISGTRGYFLSENKKLLHALSWFTISLIVIFSFIWLTGQYRQIESQKAYPPTSEAIIR